MDKCVFQIDQECFIIVLKEKPNILVFRIGNSPIIKELCQNIQINTILTSYNLGNLFYEPELFTILKNQIYYGTKNEIDKLSKLFQQKQFNIKNMKLNAALSNSTFKINDNISLYFSTNGNVIINNNNHIVFDLERCINNYADEKKEIKILSENIKKSEIYAKDSGIIKSGKSLFVFSKNNFLCISESDTIALDAIRVSINPKDINMIYIKEGVALDISMAKILHDEDIKTKKLIVNYSEKFFTKLLKPDTIFTSYPNKETIDETMEDLRFFFQNNRISIFFDNMKLSLTSIDGFTDENKFLKIETLANKNKTNINTKLEERAVILFKEINNTQIQKDKELSEINPFSFMFKTLDNQQWDYKYKTFIEKSGQMKKYFGEKQYLEMDKRYQSIFQFNNFLEKERNNFKKSLKESQNDESIITEETDNFTSKELSINKKNYDFEITQDITKLLLSDEKNSKKTILKKILFITGLLILSLGLIISGILIVNKKPPFEGIEINKQK